MPSEHIASSQLSAQDFDKIRRLGVAREFKKDELIFADGDSADYIYFIERGHVYIFIDKFTTREEISTMGAGEYFGEMAFFSGDRRSASAAALLDSTLLLVDRNSFLALFASDQDLAGKINRTVARRNRELAGKESLGGWEGGNEIKIGIKGDPSLRETAFSRERYDSVVDKIITELQPRLYDLLLNRSAFEIFIHCNSGEVRIRTACDPFSDEIHPAAKLLNVAYIDRHFPPMEYRAKTEMIKRIYGFIADDERVSRLPDLFADARRTHLAEWKPVSRQEIARTIARLAHLRRIPNFYLRNFTISTVRDAIRMQFNCDGTQIVSARGFQQFIEDNLLEEEFGGQTATERRVQPRRSPGHYGIYMHGERRSPPGRRREDWAALIGHDALDS